MYRIARTGADAVPLDFNLPRRPDSLAGALCPDPVPHDTMPGTCVDTVVWLAEVGVSAHGVRKFLASGSASGFCEWGEALGV